MDKVIIIGGGLGGLFCGAILSKEGKHVTVLEKNATIGGGLQTFTRFGETFDTGMHVVGGMQPGGNVWRICRYLGIADQVNLREVDEDCTDMLYFSEDRQHYAIAKGKEKFVESLARVFPQERENLKRYVKAYCSDLDNYDVLIGMDIITETDFLITNADGKTTFQFRTPSEGGVKL